MNNLEKAMQIQNKEEKIKALGVFLGVAFHGGMDSEQQQIFDKAQATLLAIPGHAKSYQDRIESLRAEVLSNAKLSEDEIANMQQAGKQLVYLGDYNDFREDAFLVLGQLPSSETVAVLGHYLNDPEGRDHKNLLGRYVEAVDYSPSLPNANAAAKAIRKLGIEHPPLKTPEGREWDFLREGEVDAWKDWWNEVKDGKRTYRFIGSSTEYGPDGPASKEVIERAGMYRKRDEERTTGKRTVNPVSESVAVIPQRSKPSSIAGIIVACTLVAGAIWYFLRGKRKS